MNDYDVYGDFMFYKQPTSANDVARMQKTRNPIIQTDKNTESLVNISKQQTNILNTNAQINKENSETIKHLVNQIETMQISADKQYSISLKVSICAAVCAFGSLILGLIQIFK